MIDIKHIIAHQESYRKSITDRQVHADIDALIQCYHDRNTTLQKVEQLQQQRNALAKESATAKDDQTRSQYIEQGKELKNAINELEETLQTQEKQLTNTVLLIPNLCHPDAPIGKEEKDNLVIKQVGEPTTFSFTPQDHIQLGQFLDIIDFESAKKTTGTKFYFLKNQAVLLELALLQFGINILTTHGFDIYTTPDLAKIEMIHNIGFNPRGPESDIYCLDDNTLGLIGTSEITLGAYHANSIIPLQSLPIKMAGISHCYRKEAGAAGQYSKGLYRVHQFTKLEMFIFCHHSQSETLHQLLLSIEEELYQQLAIPYRVVDICTGDLGNPHYRKYDIEAWMPGRGEGEYGEITSASTCTDYQSQRLNIRVQEEDKKKSFVHTLNGTAIAVSRILVAILENFQQEDGSVAIPEVLQPYCGFSHISPPS